jgi:transposase
VNETRLRRIKEYPINQAEKRTVMSERPAPRLRTVDRQQVIPSMPLEDLLDTDHQARLVWDFCKSLDLSPLYDAVRSRVGGPGHPAIDPLICAALWLYATLEGVGSARALARLCSQHHAFRWLAGGVSVNHHTLADFRVAHLDFLDGLLTRSVAVLREQDLVDLNRVAIDGMRVRACAGAASFRRKATLEEHLEEAKHQVARLKEEMDDDPAAASRRQAAARERAARERRQRLDEALGRMPELEAKKKADERHKARASTTDPEATVMKMADGGYRPAYNVQYAAATDGQVIVGVGVMTTGSDMGQITPMLDQVEARTGERPKEALADGGFAKHQDMEEAQALGTTAYVPVPEPKDETRDRFEPLPDDSPVIAEWRRRMKGDEAKEIYKGRAATVECVNAQARNHGLIRLLVRGVQKVKAVALWHAVAHNVRRWFSLRGEAALGG